MAFLALDAGVAERAMVNQLDVGLLHVLAILLLDYLTLVAYSVCHFVQLDSSQVSFTVDVWVDGREAGVYQDQVNGEEIPEHQCRHEYRIHPAGVLDGCDWHTDEQIRNDYQYQRVGPVRPDHDYWLLSVTQVETGHVASVPRLLLLLRIVKDDLKDLLPDLA